MPVNHPTPFRFKASRTVGAYLGLTARHYQSGEAASSGSISHRGDHGARKALYISGRNLLTHSRADCRLRRWGLKIAAAKGKKVAFTACARKLAVLLHHLWVTGQDYDPNR